MKSAPLLLWAVLLTTHALFADEKPVADRAKVWVKVGVERLLEMQAADGSWHYEGVHRVKGRIPEPYKIGGSAIVGEALLVATPPDHSAANKALQETTRFILQTLEKPELAPSTRDVYDVRVWGHMYALMFFCRLQAAGRAGDQAEAVRGWIPKLVGIMRTEEIPGGGWNYNNRRSQCSFVSAPGAQALLLAKGCGVEVPNGLLTRAHDVLVQHRLQAGAFYYGAKRPKSERATVQGSIGRGPLCEATLLLLGGGSQKDLRVAIDSFHKHWDQLEVRRKKTGTHVPPYGIAPYYFYFTHRFVGQAIELLPEKERKLERKRLLDRLAKTRDRDGTWNDRVFPQSRGYGTAMALLAILAAEQSLPPRVARKQPSGTSGR